MKIELDALLYNSWGECENGWCAEADSVSGAVEKLKDVSLEGSPDCEMTMSFKLFNDEEKLVYSGNWEQLRKLREEEIKLQRNFSEDELYTLLYQVKDYLITENLLNHCGSKVIGVFSGTKYQADKFCEEHVTDESFYSCTYLRQLNK